MLARQVRSFNRFQSAGMAQFIMLTLRTFTIERALLFPCLGQLELIGLRFRIPMF